MNDGISLVVDGRSGCATSLQRMRDTSSLRWLTFIQDEELATTDDSSSKCQDLTLANRQVSTTAGNGSIESDPSFIILALDGEQAGSTKGIVERGVVVLIERIRVPAPSERATQQLRNLRDDRDFRPQSVQVYLARQSTIVKNISFGEDISGQRQRFPLPVRPTTPTSAKRRTSYAALPDRLAKFNSVLGISTGKFHRKSLGQARVALPEGPSFVDGHVHRT